MKRELAFCLVALLSVGAATAQYAQRAQQARAPVAANQARRTTAFGPSSAFNPAAQMGATLSAARTVRGAAGVAGQSSVGGISQAVNMFCLDTGRLPSDAEGLNSLLQPPPGVKNWKGPYISVSPQRGLNDPWGTPYRYINTTRGTQPSFTIKSNGPDRTPDTADDLSISG